MDHRLARFGAVTIEGFVERAAALLAMGGDVRFRVTEIADATPDAALYFIRASGHAADGGDFELEDWSVVSFRDGRFTRLEQFPADARADAEAAFAGLTASRDPAQTMASRFLERWIASTAVGDRAALAAMAAPDVVMESRRPIVGVSLDGRQDVVSGWELGEQLLGRALTCETLATRGERLGLARVTWHPGDADLSVLAVGEVDAEGLKLVRAVIFEPGDEDAAYAELDARAMALAGEAAATLRVCFTAIDDLNAHRLDVLALDPLATLIDHRSDGWGTLTPSQYVGFVRTMYGLAEQFQVRVVEVPRANAKAALSRVRVTGVQAGGAFVLEDWTVIEAVEGFIGHLEQFPLDQRKEAEACFERLGGD